MRVIGLLGGMSWESTATYYRCINEAVSTRLGGLHSAELLLYSVDFDEHHRMHQDQPFRCRQIEPTQGADEFMEVLMAMHDKITAQNQMSTWK